MRKTKTTIITTVFKSINELPKEINLLMLEAKKITEKAYAPYSKFKVGAALLLENDKVILGNNQENAAYPSGMCAERVAIWNASVQYPNTFVKALAITVKASSHKVTSPVAPCGACRQSLLEYESKQPNKIEVYFMGEEGEVYKVNSVLDLLPLAFDKSFL